MSTAIRRRTATATDSDGARSVSPFRDGRNLMATTDDDKRSLQLECPVCGKSIVMRATEREAAAAELECRGADDAPHDPALLVIRTMQSP